MSWYSRRCTTLPSRIRSTAISAELRSLTDGIAALLRRAQAAGEIRADVRVDEVLALLSSTCQGAMRAGWDEDLQDRTLAIVFAGLRQDLRL